MAVGDVLAVALAGRHQVFQRILAVQRHQLVAQLIIGRMQAYCQGHIQIFAELIHLRNHPGGGHGNTLFTNAVAQIIFHDPHGREHLVVIEQGLAHAHHHHIGNRVLTQVTARAKGAACLPHLADDLGAGHVALKALLAGGAKAAIHCTAHLG